MSATNKSPRNTRSYVVGRAYAGPAVRDGSIRGATPGPSLGLLVLTCAILVGVALVIASVRSDSKNIGAGGVPTKIGDEPVLSGAAARLAALDASDDAQFLVRVWHDSGFIPLCGGLMATEENPLTPSCPEYDIRESPGRLVIPDEVALPLGDGPLVLRVHSRDKSANLCAPQLAEDCRAAVVADEVAWERVNEHVSSVRGPVATLRRLIAIPIAETRTVEDGTRFILRSHLSWAPAECGPDWPSFVFQVHGDPRLSLVAIFGSVAAREAFQASHEPSDAVACAGPAFERPAVVRWIDSDNGLVLSFSDDDFAQSVSSWMSGSDDERVDPVGRRYLEDEAIVADYVAARASGQFEVARSHLIGVDPNEWLSNVRHRLENGQLVPRAMSSRRPQGDELELLAAAQAFLAETVESERVVTVDYAGSSGSTEEYLVFATPASTSRRWVIVPLPSTGLVVSFDRPSSAPVQVPDGDRSCGPEIECPPH